jgi:hypothetical protein
MSYPITAFQKDQGKASQATTDMVYALKTSENYPTKIDRSFAEMYYSMSSLVSYMTLQSRYIIPPDVSMEVKTQKLLNSGDAYYIAPHLDDRRVYEFPTKESFSKATTQGTSSEPTILISWINKGLEASPIDTAINWGHSISGTPYDLPGLFPLKTAIPLPKVVQSKFIQLADTPEIATNIRNISDNKKSINALEDRITKLETFLSTFLPNQVDSDTPSNYYLGLQHLQSVPDPSWNDISSSGVWRRLV